MVNRIANLFTCVLTRTPSLGESIGSSKDVAGGHLFLTENFQIMFIPICHGFLTTIVLRDFWDVRLLANTQRRWAGNPTLLDGVAMLSLKP